MARLAPSKICIFLNILLIFIICNNKIIWSQGESNRINMAIPSSPAFAILGVNPEMVMRPSDIKSVKVDWRIKNYNLAPDLALEAQPFWQLYYKRKNLDKYLNASPFSQKLASTSFSLATAKIDGVNHISYAFKINLYKERMNELRQDFENNILSEKKSEILEIDMLIDSLVRERFATTDPDEKETCSEMIDELYLNKITIEQEVKDLFKNNIENAQHHKWNLSMLDFAFGRVMTYDNGGLDSLKFRGAGVAFWLNGCQSVGKNGLMTGLLRYSYQGKSSNYQVGLSYRYGSPKYNVFIETVYERLGNYFDKDSENPFDDEEIFAGKFESDIGNSWLYFNPQNATSQYTIAYGGDFKLTKNILLNFSLRTQLSGNFDFTRFLPVANVICLMN